MLYSEPSTSDAAKIKKQWAQASKALSNAKQRCTNKNNKDYANYGGMGIQVLIDLAGLVADIGLPPDGRSLDRIDTLGHYEAVNLRWATKALQAVNKKSSSGGSTLPLHILIKQQKFIVDQEKLRPKVTEAWWLLLKAFNSGRLSQTESTIIGDNLNIVGLPNEPFVSRTMLVEGKKQVVFSMPSLTLPEGIVDARAPLNAAPDEEVARRCLALGQLFRLRDVEGSANIPSAVYRAIDRLRKAKDCWGLTLVGRPTKDDLKTGWFEVWMLAASCRLSHRGLHSAVFPALTCIDLLNEFGGQHKWDQVSHPVLDAKLLFIPDFQLDCGPWGYLDNYRFGMLERLLKYRRDCELKTIVGIQAPNKLTPSLQKILIGEFETHEVANKITLVSDIKFVGKSSELPVDVSETESHKSADNFEECDEA